MMEDNLPSLDTYSEGGFESSVSSVVQVRSEDENENHPMAQEINILHQQLQQELKATGKRTDSIDSLARKVMEIDAPLRKKCKALDPGELLVRNRHLSDNGEIKKIITALDLLSKYALNLLKPNKNINWRSISKSNKVYQNKVTILKGHDDVLKKLGYSDERESSFDFPIHHFSADKDKVMKIAADIIIIHRELSALEGTIHPNPNTVTECFTSLSLLPTSSLSEPSSSSTGILPQKRSADAIQSPRETPVPKPRNLSSYSPASESVPPKPAPRPRSKKVNDFVASTRTFSQKVGTSSDDSDEDMEESMDTSLSDYTPKEPPNSAMSQEKYFKPIVESEVPESISKTNNGLLTPQDILQTSKSITLDFDVDPLAPSGPRDQSLMDFLKEASQQKVVPKVSTSKGVSSTTPNSDAALVDLDDDYVRGSSSLQKNLPREISQRERRTSSTSGEFSGGISNSDVQIIDLEEKSGFGDEQSLMEFLNTQKDFTKSTTSPSISGRPKMPAKPSETFPAKPSGQSPAKPPVKPSPKKKAEDIGTVTEKGLEVIQEKEARKCYMCEDKDATKQCDVCNAGRCDKCDKLWHTHPTRREHVRKQIVVPAADPPPRSPTPPPPKECNVCGESNTTIHCEDCDDYFCEECDTVFHKHKARQHHKRRPMGSGQPVAKQSDQTLQTKHDRPVKQAKKVTSQPTNQKKVAPKPKVLTPRQKLEEQIHQIRIQDLVVLERLQAVMKQGESCQDKHISDQLMDEEKCLRYKHQELYEKQMELEEDLETMISGKAPSKPQAPATPYMEMKGNVEKVGDYENMHAPLPMDEDHFANFVPYWLCNHCTMENTQMSNRICHMCSKTSIDPEIVDKPPSKKEQTPSQGDVQMPPVQGILLPEGNIIHRQPTPKEGTRPENDSSHTEPLYQSIQSLPSEAVRLEQEAAAREAQRQAEEAENAKQRKITQKMYEDGLQMVKAMRLAEQRGYFVEDVAIAVDRLAAEDGDPIAWLDQFYEKHIEQLQTQIAREFGSRFPCQKVPTKDIVPASEVKTALRKTGKNESAIAGCVGGLTEKINYLLELYGDAELEDISNAMVEANGNVYDASWMLQLQQAQAHQEELQPLLEKLWSVEESQIDLGKFLQECGQGTKEGRERFLRMLICQYDISWGRAETALKLHLDKRIGLEKCIEAVQQTDGTYGRASGYLSHECRVCFDFFAVSEVVAMPLCGCEVCTECFEGHFTVLIKQDAHAIPKSSCPGCGRPDIAKGDSEEVGVYLGMIQQMLGTFLSAQDHELFREKVLVWNLMKDPNFRWCTKCSSGAINEGGLKTMVCRSCKAATCFDCKREWKNQHEGLSCEQFADWLEANDPDIQQKGLTEHLAKNGIDCPKCNFRYELAKGGCMHFTCGQCKHEFCCGCNETMFHGEECKRYSSCAARGIHAHHPRDCLFYLRDEDIKDLQRLLQNHEQQYTTDAPNADQRVCQVKEQKEMPDGLIDHICEMPMYEGAGLCRKHYSEYLVGLINRHCIDPLEILSVDRIVAVLRRNEIPFNEQQGGENDQAYRQRLTQLVQERLPLEKKPPKKRKR